ncbi:hypothetical protein HYPSUDRAFT_116962, partial [Hypholoma sublateritium FD-334 SS-4]
MAPPISDDLRHCMLSWYHTDQKTPSEIAQLARCSVRTVYYILSYDRDYGAVRNPYVRTPGRSRELDTGDMNYLVSVLAARPKMYLDELQEDLLAARQVN